MFSMIQTAAAQGMGANPKPLLVALGNMALFALVGTVLLFLGFKAFDLAARKIDIEAELLKGNVAVGVLAGALLVALGIIVAASMF